MTSRRAVKHWEGKISRALQFQPGHLGGRVASAQPVLTRNGTLASPMRAASACACWDVPASALPDDGISIWNLNYPFFVSCLPEYGNFYGNDTVVATGSGLTWEAEMGYGPHVYVTITEAPTSGYTLYIQFFVGDTHDKFDLFAFSSNGSTITYHTMTSARICPTGIGA